MTNKLKKKIVIAGYGPVGQAIHAALKEHPKIEILIDDPYLGLYVDEDTIVEGVIVCVATPQGEDGKCDTTALEEVFSKYGDVKYLVKSTTDPVFFDFRDENITFSPEYIRGTTSFNYLKDFTDSTFAVYGGGEMRYWHELLKPVMPNLKDVRFLPDASQAAFTKYFLNCYLATKVSFFNQMFQVFEDYRGGDASDFDCVIDALCLDPRVSDSHTQVPGPDGEFGYGGHCFPKDMSAMIQVGKELGTDMTFLENVVEANDRNRRYT